jgi:hypothetical protein
MKGDGTKLSRKQQEAIAALLSTRTVEDAARSCNTPPRTLYRWLKEYDFDASYRAAKKAAYGQSIARLHHLSSASLNFRESHAGSGHACGDESSGCR